MYSINTDVPGSSSYYRPRQSQAQWNKVPHSPPEATPAYAVSIKVHTRSIETKSTQMYVHRVVVAEELTTHDPPTDEGYAALPLLGRRMIERHGADAEYSTD